MTSKIFRNSFLVGVAGAAIATIIGQFVAPATPMLRHFMPQNSSKMKIGSSMILTIAPSA